jgi:hypothetical protein
MMESIRLGLVGNQKLDAQPNKRLHPAAAALT